MAKVLFVVSGPTYWVLEGVGLAPRAPWLLETDVQEKVGVNFSRGPM
jgi:hypothetical protein